MRWNREVSVGDYIFTFSNAPGRITCISGTVKSISEDEVLEVKLSNDVIRYLKPEEFDIISRTEPTKWF